MYKEDFKNYLNSTNYYLIENDPIYQELQTLLINNIPENTYLDVEELLHAEILFKLEMGFKEGYYCGVK